MQPCPYCKQELQPTKIKDRQDQEHEILECFGCGGHWLPKALANDLTTESTISIDAILPKITFTAPEEPRCPQCSTRLTTVKHDSVANGIKVLACPQGHGNFFPKGELIKFKKAQTAKITYHEIWGIPIKSVFSVLLPVVAFVAIAGGVPVLIQSIQTPQETRTKASSTYTEPLITTLSPTSAFISFQTTALQTSKLDLYQGDKLIKQYDVKNTPSKNHVLRVTDLEPNIVYSYKITLKNEAGKIEVTPLYYLNLEGDESSTLEEAPELINDAQPEETMIDTDPAVENQPEITETAQEEFVQQEEPVTQ